MCDTKKRALALGFFDGLHIAHAAVLGAAKKEEENGLSPAVLLFDRHPAEVLFDVRVPRLLTEADRDALLRDMGFELIKLPFASVRDLSPAAFVGDLLKKELGCAAVSCGYNYTFGAGGAGRAQDLADLCTRQGIAVTVCPQVCAGGMPVSSSAIRRAVEAGEMDKAVQMLGRPFTYTLPVVPGDRRGRKLGAPTVNQFLPADFTVPKFGVYASVTDVEGVRYASVTNVGLRPTFGGGSARSETYIIGFSGDLYGKSVRVGLFSFLREEQRFSSARALTAQIGLDAAAAAELAAASPYFKKEM